MNIYSNIEFDNKCDYVIKKGYINGKLIDYDTLFRGFGIENGKTIYLDSKGFSDDEILKIITRIAVNVKDRKNDKVCLFVVNTTMSLNRLNELVKKY